MENYKFVKDLGKGSYGEVQLVKHLLEDKEYVLKKIGLHNATIKERFAAEQEAALLYQLKHINIVSYKQSFQYDSTLFIIMQYCEGGDLHTWLANRKGRYLEEAQVVFWFVQIALALQYLHSKNILHRDIKTQNIFLSRKNEIIKLGDLGIARKLSCSQDMARTVIGTPYYMSPELFSNRPYNFKSDVWSLGCVVYEMCTMKHAFRARDFSGLAYKICTGQVPPLPDDFSTELSCLVASMLEQEPDDRPNMTEILHQKFIRSYLQKFVKRNRNNTKQPTTKTPTTPSTRPRRPPQHSTDDSDDGSAALRSAENHNYAPSYRNYRSNSIETSKPADKSTEVATKPADSDHCAPHIRVPPQFSSRRRETSESDKHCDKSSKRLSNSHHLTLIPSVSTVVDILRKDDSYNLHKSEDKPSNFVRGEPKRSSSKDSLKEAQEHCTQISSARKRRIQDKRNKSRSNSRERASPDIFSSHSSGSGSPSPTLDMEKQQSKSCSNIISSSKPPTPQSKCSDPTTRFQPRPPSPDTAAKYPPRRPPSPDTAAKHQSRRHPSPDTASKHPPRRPPSPDTAPKLHSRPPSPGGRRSSSPIISRPASPLARPESPQFSQGGSSCSRPDSPVPASRPESPKVPQSPKIKSRSCSKTKHRPLPPTPPLARECNKHTASEQDDQTKLVDLMNKTLSVTRDADTPQISPDISSTEQPQISRLKERLARLRNQVLPCVSRDILEKAYRVLDESDPDKVQGKLMLLLGSGAPAGMCNKVMEMYICENRLKTTNRTLFQSM